MASLNVQPFKVTIPDAELSLLKKKLELSRLPTNITASLWGEPNGISVDYIRDLVDHWTNKYDWRAEEQKINQMPQFKAKVELEDFGEFDIHFVHVQHKDSGAIPLLYLHGWPGSFIEVSKILKPLESAGYHVIAPSLPGFGFSSYTDKEGFKHWHHGEIMHKLMTGLGYEKYVVAGGDWGAMITGSMALKYPESIQAIHLTVVFVLPPKDKGDQKFSEFELNSLARMQWFGTSENAYGQVQKTKPRTIGFAMHDSPVGMLAWMVDKLLMWTDEYPWTKDELITWALLHYFPGPTTAFQMYRENLPVFETGEAPPGVAKKYVTVPTGVSAFAKEVFMIPQSWAEKEYSIASWTQHKKGGHFPAYERPEELSGDIIPFMKAQWKA